MADQKKTAEINPAKMFGPIMAIVVMVTMVNVIGGLNTSSGDGTTNQYTCPYCGATFTTYEELAAHVQTVHPGQRIPIDISW